MFIEFCMWRYNVAQKRAWWRHQMETFSALLAICAGNSPVPGEFPTQRPVTRSFDVYFDLRPNKWLSKQSWGWWFETLSCSLWRHRNGIDVSQWQWSCKRNTFGQWCGAFSLICALNKRSNKQSSGWWFETPSHPLRRYRNVQIRHVKCFHTALFPAKLFNNKSSR